MHMMNVLERKYNAGSWWPMARGFRPSEWEVCAGAILTQNTSWSNVEKALDNMKKAGITNARKTLSCSDSMLRKLVRPSGFYNQKACRLKALARFVLSFRSFRDFQRSVTREQLLGLKGVGKETADAILLYACHRPFFVVDAYTRRVFSRLGYIRGDEEYDAIRLIFEKHLMDAAGMKKMHGLIVEHAKHSCRKEPQCASCAIRKHCAFSSCIKI